MPVSRVMNGGIGDLRIDQLLVAVHDLAAETRTTATSSDPVVDGAGPVVSRSKQYITAMLPCLVQLRIVPSPARRRTASIGVLVQDLSRIDFCSAVLRAIEDRARAQGVVVMASSVDKAAAAGCRWRSSYVLLCTSLTSCGRRASRSVWPLGIPSRCLACHQRDCGGAGNSSSNDFMILEHTGLGARNAPRPVSFRSSIVYSW